MFAKFSALSIYTNPKIITIALLGFASGLPLALTASTLGIWLTEEGISKTAIGIFALLGTPYVIKFLWAPLIDQMSLPFFSNRFGRRRGWIIFSQIMLIIFLVMLGASNPQQNPWNTALAALLVAIASATQDIVIDAYRVDILDDDQQGAGAAAVVFGYRIGMLVSSAGALIVASFFGWFAAYCVMSAFILVGMVTTFLSPEPDNIKLSAAENFAHWFARAVIEPFANFMGKQGWGVILVFIILYKLGDAFAGVMTGPFLIDIGFSKIEIATIVKTYGVVATLIGAFIGGSIVARYGLIKSLWICGILQMVSNLMFVIQAHIGYDNSILVLTISIENLAGGMGTAAFVAYISKLCNANYTATQYALFSALAATGRTWLSSSSGYFVDLFGWVNFFLISTALAIPGILLLIVIGKQEQRKERL